MLNTATKSKPMLSRLASTKNRGTKHILPNTLVSAYSSSPKTFDLDGSVPRLGIPDIKQTASRYLNSVKPWLSADEFAQTSSAVSNFLKPNGLGSTLQARLKEYDSKQKYSWLEKIWLDKAYLEYREPCFLNVNWFATISDSEKVKANSSSQLSSSNLEYGIVSDIQVERAAILIAGFLDFNKKLNMQEIKPETDRAGNPLCMSQYKNQFGTTRIPNLNIDEMKSKYPNFDKHIMVMCRNKIFKLQVIGNNNERFDEQTIMNALVHIARLAQNSDSELPVGILTASNRDVWAKSRAELISISSQNNENFESIDTALFSVSLDTDIQHPLDLSYKSNVFLRGQQLGGLNRWFDKAIQIIVMSDGSAGVNCEHTPVDANTTGRIITEALINESKSTYNFKPASYSNGGSTSGSVSPNGIVIPLNWTHNSNTESVIKSEMVKTKNFSDNVNLKVDNFDEFGSDAIKSLKQSPDSFVQMAIQLAYYKQHKAACPTYEAASIRNFSHGRTECVRVCSSETLDLQKAMTNNDHPALSDATPKSKAKEIKLELFKRAVAGHQQYMAWALSGQGIDRHLLGLKVMATADELAQTDNLFGDSAFYKSFDYRLSTSNVSPARMFRGGFAPVVLNGYGIAYGIDKDVIRFALSSWLNSNETNLDLFKSDLFTSADEIRHLLQ
ncbi:Choline O-acetyltransferase [Smittium culicis]|uniref:Choline O-acetyltransferase n=1 Tax=Smittium culicis TaxID=133412 RepID=A0A1R1YD20_9FUNG|nr:Choline O-acetyltransferase [Smittium culicis]